MRTALVGAEWARPGPGEEAAPWTLGRPPVVPPLTPPDRPAASTPPNGAVNGASAPVASAGAPGAWKGAVPAGGAVPGRHPEDPEEVPSSKASAVFALGVVGVALMLCGGGLVPGLVGLVLAGPARRELDAAAGFLTGRRLLRTGEMLSWLAVAVSVVVVVVVVIGLLIGSVGESGPEYGENVN